MRIGCFGISANPPHLGHLEAAQTIRDSGLVDEVWIIPVFKHPFEGIESGLNKKDLAPWEMRFVMAWHLEESGIHISDVEGERGEVSYTFDTLAYLRDKYPQHTFSWCIGSDAVVNREYEKWYRWDDLDEQETFFVVGRSGYLIGSNERKECFVVIGKVLGDPISSTDVQKMVREEKDVTLYVGEEIAEYIKKHNLYTGGLS